MLFTIEKCQKINIRTLRSVNRLHVWSVSGKPAGNFNEQHSEVSGLGKRVVDENWEAFLLIARRLTRHRHLQASNNNMLLNSSLDITRALKVSIRGLPKDWRCPPGRPLHTWLRTLEADLRPLNLGLNSAWKYTQDREHWKHLMETATLQLGACSWWCVR